MMLEKGVTLTLDGFRDNHEIIEQLNKFFNNTSNNENKQCKKPEITQTGLESLKCIYEFICKCDLKSLNKDNLDGNVYHKKLYTEGFDLEQIWPQIEKLSNKLKSASETKFLNIKDITNIFIDDIEDIIDSTLEEETQISNNNSKNLKEKIKINNKKGTTVVEDEFLKLDEMESFVKEAEALGEDNEDSSGSEVMFKNELFKDNDDSEDNNDVIHELYDDPDALKSKDEKGGDDIYYKDFFRKKTRNDKRKLKKNEIKSNQKTKIKKEKPNKVIINEEISEEEEEEEDSDNENLTRHEKEQKKMMKEIAKLEKEAVADKEWMYQGEVSASKRPKDAALDVEMDFSAKIPHIPEMTEKEVKEMEKIIKKRILANDFDDVVPRPEPIRDISGKLIELDTGKAKQGLGEIYEKEYLDTANLDIIDRKIQNIQNEAKKLYKTVCLSLDALTHYHMAPEMIIEDKSINPNIASIAMEEAIPEAIASAHMVAAPEEVYKAKNKAKELKTEGEFTKSDRNKRRAAMKRIYKKRHGNVNAPILSNKKIKIAKNRKKYNKDSKSFFKKIEADKGMRKNKKPFKSNKRSIAVKL